MHHYPFHVGDYQSHTKHLTQFEDLAYRRMLDECYLHERPLPISAKAIARQINMREHVEAIELVLLEFFVKTDEGWINARVTHEIQQYHAAQAARSRGGKASAARRVLENAGKNEVHFKSTSSPAEDHRR